MSKRYPMIEHMKRGPFDDIPTPQIALDRLLPYIPIEWLIWEIAPGDGQMVATLRGLGYGVVADGVAFPRFESPPEHDVIVTNPPFSQKANFLKHVAANRKPWALLLPVTTLGVGRCQPYLTDCEILFFSKRIDFTGKGAPWFAVAWFTYGLNIGRQLNFEATWAS